MGFLDAKGLKHIWDNYIAKALEKKVDKETGKGLSTNDYTTEEKNKLDGIAAGAEVNQNAFSNIKVGDVTVTADDKTDTLTLVAGENVTITSTDAGIEIKAEDTVYTHPEYETKEAGLYKITVDKMGHVSEVTAISKEDITALGIPGEDKDTTYTGSDGITLTGTNFTNSGVRSVSIGDTDGTIKVNTNGTETEVVVAGLKSAAYTESSAYATSAQGTKADDAMPKSGGKFTGDITLKGDPTDNLHPVTKQYLDSELLEINDKFDNITHPVTSVNGKTGDVVITASDVGALPDDTVIPPVYIHPDYDPVPSGLYKITVDEMGHVCEATPVTKDDITNLEIPGQDTTYTAGVGIEISDTNVISNTGVLEVGTGTTDGTIKVSTKTDDAEAEIIEVAVAGLKSAAFTESSDYATGDQGTKADNAMPKSGGEFTGDTIFSVGGTKVWISFTDAEGNATSVPYLHWIE